MFIYNDKIDYLMCKWIKPPRKNHNEFNLRDSFYYKKTPITKDEMQILLFRSAFLFFIKNDFDNGISELAKIFEIDKLESKKLINQTLNKTVDFDLFANLVLSKGHNIVFLILYYNSLRVNNNEIPIIFRADQVERIVNYLNSNNIDQAKSLYMLCYENTFSHTVQNNIKSFEELRKIIKSSSKELKKLYVNEIYTYGSFGRGEISKYSDLDLVVVTTKKLTDVLVLNLHDYLDSILKASIDLTVFYQQIDFSIFDQQMKTDMKKIIKL